MIEPPLQVGDRVWAEGTAGTTRCWGRGIVLEVMADAVIVSLDHWNSHKNVVIRCKPGDIRRP